MAVTLFRSGIELALGRPLPPQEMADYLHLWRLIGWLMGLDEQLNPCAHGVAHGKAQLESILMHLLKPNELSRSVALNLLRSPLANGAVPDLGTRYEVARHYLGPAWSKALGFPYS